MQVSELGTQDKPMPARTIISRRWAPEGCILGSGVYACGAQQLNFSRPFVPLQVAANASEPIRVRTNLELVDEHVPASYGQVDLQTHFAVRRTRWCYKVAILKPPLFTDGHLTNNTMRACCRRETSRMVTLFVVSATTLCQYFDVSWKQFGVRTQYRRIK